MSEYNNNQDEYQLPHLNGTPVQMLSSAFGISETSALAVTNQQNYEVKFNIAAPPSEVNGEVLEEFTEADLDKLSELLPPLDESTWLQLNAESHQGFNCQVIEKLEYLFFNFYFLHCILSYLYYMIFFWGPFIEELAQIKTGLSSTGSFFEQPYLTLT